MVDVEAGRAESVVQRIRLALSIPTRRPTS